MTMTANPATVDKLLAANVRFVLPRYQRRYTWGEEEWEALWEDILTTVDRNNNGSSYTHFLGPLVTMKVSGHGASRGPTPYFVVDGQQRLTTILLLFKAAYDIAVTHNIAAAQQDVRPYIWANDGEPKLIPTRKDQNAFECALTGDPGALEGYGGQIANAYERFVAWISDKYAAGNWSEEEREENFRNLIDVVAQQFQLVEIHLSDNNDYAYEVFHSLNTKGSPLAESDKIRNYVLLKISPLGDHEVDNFYRDTWQPIEDVTADAANARQAIKALDRFFYLWTSIVPNKQFRESQLFGHFKDVVDAKAARRHAPAVEDDATGAPEALREIAQDILGYAPAYQHIRSPDRFEQGERSLRARLEALGCLGVREVADYVLLEIMRQYLGNRPHALDHVESVLKIIESYLVWRRLCGIPGKQNNRIFVGLAHHIRERAQHPSEIADVITNILSRDQAGGDRWPRFDELVHGVENQRAFWPGRAAWTRVSAYILARIESHLCRDQQLPALDTLTIEHIMPQAAGPEWLNDNRQDYADMNDRRDNLPNLTLLTTAEQARAGARAFEWKRLEIYSSSRFSITQRLGNVRTWNLEQLQQRAKFLADQVREIWPYPGEGG